MSQFILAASFVITAFIPNVFADEVVVYLKSGQTINANVTDCAPGEYGHITDQYESKKPLTAECLPITCEYRSYWNIFGGPAATITLIPSGKVIGSYPSKEEAKSALKKFIESNVCRKSRHFVPAV